MVAQCSVGGQPKIGPLQYTYVVVSFVGEVMVQAGCFTFATIPNKVYLVTTAFGAVKDSGRHDMVSL
jgi:hypothetical protein